MDNTQVTIFGGFAPNSSSADILSRALGTRTVMSGTVSRGKNDPSQSLQMMEHPLLTADELKSLPKGHFIVMKTGVHPMRVKMKLFFKWGIEFNEKEPYVVPDQGNRTVQYAEKQALMAGIIRNYRADWGDRSGRYNLPQENGQVLRQKESHFPYDADPEKRKGGRGLKTGPYNDRNRYGQAGRRNNGEV